MKGREKNGPADSILQVRAVVLRKGSRGLGTLEHLSVRDDRFPLQHLPHAFRDMDFPPCRCDPRGTSERVISNSADAR